MLYVYCLEMTKETDKKNMSLLLERVEAREDGLDLELPRELRVRLPLAGGRN